MKSILALTIASIFILAAVSHGCEKGDNGTVYRVRTPDGVYINLYRYENNGTPLLLIPGMFETISSLIFLVKALQDSCIIRVLMYGY